ncbi:MAG: LysM peptidoglycan-binding domain-containing protein, partial [Anaerolineae bacterium]|nr:LysM peptidoglycan-binding domain-containing protein [Anaerolineae bacterium]
MRRFLIPLIMLILLLPLVPAAGQDENFIQHRVLRGETLMRISLQYGVPIASIVEANPSIRNPNLSYAGSILLIPTGSTPPAQP